MFGIQTEYFLLTAAITVISMLVSGQLKRKFAHYSKLRLANGMSGAEIAEKMLHDHGIYDVKIISTRGQLTDHYNPMNKTVNLSESVYNQRNTAAAAVAAHEVGHAVQHAVSYSMLQFRSKMVPMVNISSKLSTFVILGGFVLYASQGIPAVLYIGICLFAVVTLFSFVTLPVEYDASNRALKWLKEKNMVQGEEYAGAKDALKWAARTYVVAAIGSLAQLVYYISLLNRRN